MSSNADNGNADYFLSDGCDVSAHSNSNRMFSFVTKTVNVITGDYFNCKYCWARSLEDRYRQWNGFAPMFHKERLSTPFKRGQFIFLNDMGDFGDPAIPANWIDQVIDMCKLNPKTKFLWLTKNPARYLEFFFPDNCVLGATIESDLNYPQYSKAPKQTDRISAMVELNEKSKNMKFISIEPVLKFSIPATFANIILDCGAKFVAIGYDNHGCRLEEPALDATNQLIDILSKTIKVYRKRIRDPWWKNV